MGGCVTGMISDKKTKELNSSYHSVTKMKLVYLVFLLVLVIPFAFADESFIFKHGETFALEIPIAKNDLSSCTSCTCEFSIYYPNGSAFIQSISGTNSNGYCKYTSRLYDTGLYGGEIYFTDGVDYGRATFEFEITATGKQFSTQKAIGYIILYVISILIFIALLVFGIYMPYENKKDEMSGYILAVSNLKYLKMFLLALAYLDAIFISYFSWMIGYAYLDMDFVSNIFKFAFYGLTIALFPLFILACYLVIANLIRDSKVSEMIQRGFKTRG